MKKLIFGTFMFLGTLGMVFLVSCKDDDDVVIINEGPQINVQANGGQVGGDSDSIYAVVGQNVVLNIDVSDDDGVDSVVIVKYVDNVEVVESTQVVYPSVPGEAVVQDVEVNLGDVEVNVNVRIEITAYDSEGNSNTEVVVVNISDPIDVDPTDPVDPTDTTGIIDPTIPTDTTGTTTPTDTTGTTGGTGGTGTGG